MWADSREPCLKQGEGEDQYLSLLPPPHTHEKKGDLSHTQRPLVPALRGSGMAASIQFPSASTNHRCLLSESCLAPGFVLSNFVF